MTTPDRSWLPISEDALAAIANQLYASLPASQVGAAPAAPAAPPGPSAGGVGAAAPGVPALPSGPPGIQPVAPRGSAPQLAQVSSLAATAAGLATAVPGTPEVLAHAASSDSLPAAITPVVPGPEFPPVTGPASRGSATVPNAEASPPPATDWNRPRFVAPADFGWAAPSLAGVAGSLGRGDGSAVPAGTAEPSPRPNGAPSELPISGPLPFDVERIRADFPILHEEINGYPLVWFDNAATTQKPKAVIDRLVRFYEHENSNIQRSAHELAARATDAHEDARTTIARFIGASSPDEVSFVRGTTEGINLVAQSWGRHNLSEGDEILITGMEHHANIVPWQLIARRTGAVLKVAPIDDDGNLLVDRYLDLLGPKTKIVSLVEVANAIGTVNPVAELTRLAKQAGARVLIDAAQSVPHKRVDLQSLDADFLVFSGHKIYGPTGIGAIFIRERVWDETPPWQGGGHMIADVTHERSLYQPPPRKYEAGTGNIADAVGLAAALRYVERIGIERIAAYEHDLLEYATPRLAAIPGVKLIGTAREKASVLSFVLRGYSTLEVGEALNERGIAVRAGHHCSQPTLRRLGVEETVRPSFAFYNTKGEIDRLIDAVGDLAGRRPA